MKTVTDREALRSFGEFIRSRRENLSLRQEDVAEMIGIKQSYYSYIERGARNVDLLMSIKICDVLGLDLQDYIRNYIVK